MQKSNITFDSIANEITHTNKFNKLKSENHHGITRYIHVLRVSKYTYKISKFFHLDYVSATRAALLHDYFTNNELYNENTFKRGILHPDTACINAQRDFILNNIEKNAITSHMFPLCHELPKYKESWVLTLVDKCVAAYEMTRYKLTNFLTLYSIFTMNMILFWQK